MNYALCHTGSQGSFHSVLVFVHWSFSAKLEDMKRRKEDASRTDPGSDASSKSATPVSPEEGGGDREERRIGEEEGEEEEGEGRIVPKLKVGADGSIVIDEER